MPKNSVQDWSTTADDNTDVGGINIAENCPSGNVNNAMREVMAQVAEDLGPSSDAEFSQVTVNGGISNADLDIVNTDATAGGIEKVNSSGAAAVTLNPKPSDNTSIAQVTMFRNTDTTGEVRLTGYRGNDTATNPFFELSTTDNNYVCALDTDKSGPNFTIGAEGSINTYKSLVSRIDYENTDSDDINNRLMEIAADGDHGTHWGPIVDLIRGGNPTNALTPSIAAPNDGDPLGVIRFTGRNDAFEAVTYSYLHTEADDVTDGTEDGILKIATIQNGSLDERFWIGFGLYAEGKVDPGDGNAFFTNISLSNRAIVTSATDGAYVAPGSGTHGQVTLDVETTNRFLNIKTISDGVEYDVGIQSTDAVADHVFLCGGTEEARISHAGVRTATNTVASLVAAATAGAGTRSFVTDATSTSFSSIVSGGGSNGVPVYSDGTNWRIG